MREVGGLSKPFEFPATLAASCTSVDFPNLATFDDFEKVCPCESPTTSGVKRFALGAITGPSGFEAGLDQRLGAGAAS